MEPNDPRARLVVLDATIDTRVTEIEGQVPNWPCGAGCDQCCRSLGAPLLITDAEFVRLWSAVEALPRARRREIDQRLAADPREGHQRICPLLDRDSGRCFVYDARPISCRTYGYYRGRDGDYWCEKVSAHVSSRPDTFVAGNQAAIDRLRDRQLGASRPLRDHVRAQATPPSRK